MKVYEMKILRVILTDDENEKLKIIKNGYIDKEKVKKYIQRFNIISVVEILDIYRTEDSFNFLISVEVKG
jgi:hypothetical protein